MPSSWTLARYWNDRWVEFFPCGLIVPCDTELASMSYRCPFHSRRSASRRIISPSSVLGVLSGDWVCVVLVCSIATCMGGLSTASTFLHQCCVKFMCCEWGWWWTVVELNRSIGARMTFREFSDAYILQFGWYQLPLVCYGQEFCANYCLLSILLRYWSFLHRPTIFTTFYYYHYSSKQNFQQLRTHRKNGIIYTACTRSLGGLGPQIFIEINAMSSPLTMYEISS